MDLLGVLGLVVASVTDYQNWWILGAFLLAAAQLAVAYSVTRAGPDRSDS